jgi:hypothetical protein
LFEPFREVVLFSNRAANRFKDGNEEQKRLILQTVCSNLFLRDKILKFEAKKPFAPLAKSDSYPHRLGVGDDVRTLRGKITRMAKGIWHQMQDEDGQRTLQNIRVLRERFEPEVVAKEKSSRPHPAKVAKGAYRARATDASWQMPPLH